MTGLPLASRDCHTTAAPAHRALAGAATLLIAVVFALTASLLAGCSASEKGGALANSQAAETDASGAASATAEPGVLVVASALNHEPYELSTSTSQNGFTIDLLNLLGEKAGLAVEFGKAVNHKDEKQNITAGEPADVAAKVSAGEADLGASTLRAGESLDGVVFTDTYLTADLVVVTKMDTAHDDLASLEAAGTKVAVSGDDAAAWVEENLPEATVQMVENDVDALVEVNSELTAAAVVDAPVFQRYVKVKEPHLQVVVQTDVARSYAFAVATDNAALLAAMNDALSVAQADGSYDTLYEKWFANDGVTNEAAASRENGTGAAPEAVQDSTGA